MLAVASLSDHIWCVRTVTARRSWREWNDAVPRVVVMAILKFKTETTPCPPSRLQDHQNRPETTLLVVRSRIVAHSAGWLIATGVRRTGASYAPGHSGVFKRASRAAARAAVFGEQDPDNTQPAADEDGDEDRPMIELVDAGGRLGC